MLQRNFIRNFIVLFEILKVVCGFYPRQPPHYTTKTHFDITNTGILQAVSTYIFEHKSNISSVSTALEEFFGSDADGKTNLFRTLSTIRNAVADTQEERRDVAYVHCHAEQIQLAHNHVIACRNQLLQRIGDVEELRKQIGVCLYTIQSFYSNTNWVEINGRTPYLDFGVKGKQLMAVASIDENTCADMTNIAKNCKDNLLVNDKLTSGYHHGRGNTKPPRPLGAAAGKCSHGGPEDESRKLVAKCGINKDTTLEELSPHSHLHNDAYYAAVAATKHFLIDKDTGILQLLGNGTFDKIFQIKQRKNISLSFAVDYSGSMSTEIAQVKESIIQLVTSTIGSQNEPADYVLSLFSDPADLNKAFLFTKGFEMIQKVSSVTVNGGGDCPELAAAGILKAIELSRAYSKVFVFTDADAKDENRFDEVAAAANAKSIAIITLLTGKCSRRRKRHGMQGRIRRDTSFFQRLAASTGGTVYNTEKQNIGNVLDEVIQDVFPTSEVIIESFIWPADNNNDRVVMVDGSVQVLKISVKGANGKEQTDFVYPNGTAETFTSSFASRIYTSNREIIISMQRLLHGMYTLRRTTSKELTVNITAQSSITVKGDMLQKTTSESLVLLRGSPLVGRNYTYVITVFNFDNGTCNTLHIATTSGKIVGNYYLQQLISSVDISCSVDIVIPNDSFQVILNGTDATGSSLYRKIPTIYRPAKVELRIADSTDDASVRKKRDVPYEVVNAGTIKDSYNVTITYDSLVSTSPFSHYHTVDAGEKINGSFVIVPEKTGMFKYTVTLSLNSTSEIQQRISRTLLVTNIERPKCDVLFLHGECGPPSLNTANCSKYNWNSVAEIRFSGTKLDSISSTGGQAILMTHDNISDIVNGPLAINISGDCCTPSVTTNIVDVDGYISQCHFDLSNGQSVQPVEPEVVVSLPPEHPIPNNTYATILVVSGCIIVLFAGIIIGVIMNNVLSRNESTKNDQTRRGKTKRTDKKFVFENRLIKFKGKEKSNENE